MTPHVIAEPGATESEATSSREKLDEIREGLNSSLESLNGRAPDDKSRNAAANEADETQEQAGKPEKLVEK
jgi:hypothetical protein